MFFQDLFSLFRPKATMNVRIVFHKEANAYGTHGIIHADHREQRLVMFPVRFAFVGMRAAPALTPEMLTYIFEEARAQGYVPYELTTYGGVVNRDAKNHNEMMTLGDAPALAPQQGTSYNRAAPTSDCSVFVPSLRQRRVDDAMQPSSQFAAKTAPSKETV